MIKALVPNETKIQGLGMKTGRESWHEESAFRFKWNGAENKKTCCWRVIWCKPCKSSKL